MIFTGFCVPCASDRGDGGWHGFGIEGVWQLITTMTAAKQKKNPNKQTNKPNCLSVRN